MWTLLLLSVQAGLVVFAEEAYPSRCNVPWSPVCERRPNWILVTAQGQAGFGDRESIIRRLGAVAEATCARMVIGPPSKLLGHHDTGTKVKAGWDEYDTVKNGDNESLLTPPSATTLATLVALLQEDKKSERQEYYVDADDGDFISQLHKAWSIYSRGAADDAAFVWHISENFYHIDRTALQRELDAILGGCKPIEVRPSALVQEAADLFLEKTIPETCQNSKPFYLLTFHLRRGDSLKSCDTSPDAVLDLARCAIQEIYHVSPSHIVLFTDDKDDDYKKAVVDQLTKLFNDTTCIFFGDDYIPPLIKGDFTIIAGGHENRVSALQSLFDIDPDDNYLTYQVTNAVRLKANLDFEKHRSNNCQTCDLLRQNTQKQQTSLNTTL